MKTSELMLCDWVSIEVSSDRGKTIDNVAVQVCTITRSKIHFYINGWHSIRYLIEVKPIPLTEVMLEANEFEKQNEEWVYEGWFFVLRVGYSNRWKVLDDNGEHVKYIKYVHELQNLLRIFDLTDLADNFKLQTK